MGRCGRIPDSSFVPGSSRRRAQTERSPVGLIASESSRKLPASRNIHFLVVAVEAVRVREIVLKACGGREGVLGAGRGQSSWPSWRTESGSLASELRRRGLKGYWCFHLSVH